MIKTALNGLTLLMLISGCAKSPLQDPYVVVLGIAQDAGVPQAGCIKECCIDRWDDPNNHLMVTALGIGSRQKAMVEVQYQAASHSPRTC